MQIHELTKRNKQVDEGILDGLKAAVNVAKTGADSFASHMIPGYDTAQAGIKAIKTGYQQGGFKGAAAASVSSGALSQAQADLDQSKLANDPRIVRGKTIQQVLAAVSKDADIKASAQKLIPSFEKQFMAPLEPDIEYTQTNKGRAELAKRHAQPTAQSVTPPPNKMAPGTKTNKSQELARLQNKQMSAASGIKEAALANRSQQRNAPVATATSSSELQKAADPNSQANQQLVQDPSNAAFKGEPIAPDEKTQQPPTDPQNSGNQLGNDIEKWVMSKIKGFTPQVKNNPEVQTILSKPFQDIQQVVDDQDSQSMPQALTAYLIAAKAATMYASQKALEKKQKPKARDGDFVDNDGDGVSDDEPEDDLAQQQSSPARRQLAINNLKAQGVDPATITKLRKLKQQGSKDVDAALNETKNQLYKELKTFKK